MDENKNIAEETKEKAGETEAVKEEVQEEKPEAPVAEAVSVTEGETAPEEEDDDAPYSFPKDDEEQGDNIVFEETTEEPAESVKPKKASKKLIFTICGIVFAVLLLALAVLMPTLDKPKVVIVDNAPTTEAEAKDEGPVKDPGMLIDTATTDIGDAIQDPFEGRYATYQGLSDMEIGPGVRFQLQNPNKDEDVFMQFTILEEGKTVFQTDFIPAGQAKEVMFYELLGEGEHEILVQMQPYLLVGEEYLACPVNNQQQIKVTVEK